MCGEKEAGPGCSSDPWLLEWPLEALAAGAKLNNPEAALLFCLELDRQPHPSKAAPGAAQDHLSRAIRGNVQSAQTAAFGETGAVRISQ